jgi:hypothetical protein
MVVPQVEHGVGVGRAWWSPATRSGAASQPRAVAARTRGDEPLGVADVAGVEVLHGALELVAQLADAELRRCRELLLVELADAALASPRGARALPLLEDRSRMSGSEKPMSCSREIHRTRSTASGAYSR